MVGHCAKNKLIKQIISCTILVALLCLVQSGEKGMF